MTATPNAPSEATGDVGRLTPQAYQHTVTTGERRLLPAVRRWLLALAAAAVALLLISYPLWRQAVSSLELAVEEALAASE